MGEVSKAWDETLQRFLSLKPGNILVVRQEDGGWRPVVVDFGIAHGVEAPGPTSRRASEPPIVRSESTPSWTAPSQLSASCSWRQPGRPGTLPSGSDQRPQPRPV